MVLESESWKRAANLGRLGEQLHDRDVLLAHLCCFEMWRCADNWAARGSQLSRRAGFDTAAWDILFSTVVRVCEG